MADDASDGCKLEIFSSGSRCLGGSQPSSPNQRDTDLFENSFAFVFQSL